MSHSLEDKIQLPTLDSFLAQNRPTNAYINYSGFNSLYVRKCDICVHIGGEMWYCTKVLTIANVTATTPKQGAFGRLVEDLCARGYAVYIENVHNRGFATHLRKFGYTQVNKQLGTPNFLYGYEGHLRKFR